jgi:hypothetical protein
VDATVLALSVSGAPTDEVGIAAPVIVNTARSHLSGNASVGAAGTVALQATTDTVLVATADGNAGTDVVGTTTATPVVFATTEAFIADNAEVTQATSIDIDASATSTITTTAISTPSGAAGTPATLADLGAATAAGSQLSAAAIRPRVDVAAVLRAGQCTDRDTLDRVSKSVVAGRR